MYAKNGTLNFGMSNIHLKVGFIYNKLTEIHWYEQTLKGLELE